MALEKPYQDVPGTTIFDADQSRKGYWLNQFCMSLMKAENRARFKAGERARIVMQGYQVLATLGDQPSDLAGGYAEKAFLMPNPFYRIP